MEYITALIALFAFCLGVLVDSGAYKALKKHVDEYIARYTDLQNRHLNLQKKHIDLQKEHLNLLKKYKKALQSLKD